MSQADFKSTISLPKYIFQTPSKNGKYYHYTKFDGFWKILENESLLATQALFSNDSQEINKGKLIVESPDIKKKEYPL